MNPFNNAVEIAEKSCQRQGKRLTQKRKLVLLALLQSQKAISAYDIVTYCKEHFNQVVPAMSVYRMLNFLQTQGLAHRLESANKYIASGQISHKHENKLIQFLICEKCQHVKEIDMNPSIRETLEATISEHGFHLNKPQLEIHGICSHCLST